MKRIAALLAGQHLLEAWRQTLSLVLMFAISIALALTSTGYQGGLSSEFVGSGSGYLVVQEPGSIGELGGSRLSPETASTLEALGVREIIPQVYRAVGVSIQEVIQMRGVDLQNYPKTISFDMVSGKALDGLSAPRQTMVGWRLAERVGAELGETIQLRGRTFTVAGIFRTGTIADNEAWVSLKDAQTLLGWGEDVSIYLIPDNGPLQHGDFPAPGLEIVRRGEAVTAMTAQTGPLVAYMLLVSQASLVSCGLTLAVILLRLAWLHRRELAILNCLGFPQSVFGIYLMVQAAVISLAGAGLGVVLTWVLSHWTGIEAAGYVVPMRFETLQLIKTAAWLAAITLAGVVIPTAWLFRMAPDEILHVE